MSSRAVPAIIVRDELFSDHVDIGGLSTYDEELALLDLRHSLKAARFPNPGLKVLLHLRKKRFEHLEVCAGGTVGDLFRSADLRSRFHIFKL